MTIEEFEHIILPCHRKMYAVAIVILNDRDEASDIVQEAFTRLWEKRKELSDITNPQSYCTAVVKRIAIDHIRRKRHVMVNIDDAMGIGDNNSEREIETGDSLQIVNKLLQSLPDNQSRVICLSAMAGMNNTEIASTTGLSDANVRTLLSRGRKMLKEMYDKINGNK